MGLGLGDKGHVSASAASVIQLLHMIGQGFLLKVAFKELPFGNKKKQCMLC